MRYIYIYIHIYIYILSAYAIEIKCLCDKKYRYPLEFPKHLHQNPPKLQKVPAPEPSGTSPSIFSAKPSGPLTRSLNRGTLPNLTRSPHRNLPEPHLASSPPRPSGTSQGLCTGTLRNLICTLRTRTLSRYLHRNPPEPHEVSAPEPSGTWSGTLCWSCTRSHRSWSGLKTP